MYFPTQQTASTGQAGGILRVKGPFSRPRTPGLRLTPILWATLLLLLVAAPALSADSGATVVVSTFEVDEPSPPGSVLDRSVRVTNLGPEPLNVQLSLRAVELLDDGQTRFGDGPDPLWAGDLTLSATQMSIPAGSSRDAVVHVAIPADMPPDDYITGLLVAPVPPAQAPVRVVNAIGALIPISVAGDRVRMLQLADHSLPSFVIGDQVTGHVRVTDVGTTLVSPWLEAGVVDSLMGTQVADIQVRDQARIGPGASRDLAYTWAAGLTAGKFRVPVRVFYNRDNSTTAEIDVEEELWLIHPAVLAAAIALALAAVGASLYVIRRKRGYLWPARFRRSAN